MVWSWSSMATTSKSSLVPPRYHCPTIGLIAFIVPDPHCYGRVHSTTNDSFVQYVYFARSNIQGEWRLRSAKHRSLLEAAERHDTVQEPVRVMIAVARGATHASHE